MKKNTEPLPHCRQWERLFGWELFQCLVLWPPVCA